MWAARVKGQRPPPPAAAAGSPTSKQPQALSMSSAAGGLAPLHLREPANDR